MTLEILEHVWIPMSDGIRLSSRVFLPEDARNAAVPAVLEYIPYRKRDGTRGRDAPMHGYFAEQGYAAVRVDIRGSGESEGHLADEYLPLEQDDACEVIAWIAEQEWCDGNVGMMGKSWSGFNSLQVAARRPPALKAIITCYSTDDRFRDDIHFMGGCLLNDNLWWGVIMMAYQARPADPAVIGAGWREDWTRRLGSLPFFPALWARHQRYDDYWKHGSIQEGYSDIRCPVLVVGAWADSYTNSVPRLLESLDVPTRGIIGPWGHVYPHDGVPGPAIGFLQEATRWWDQWLKGRDSGVMEEPKLRAYINDAVEPDPSRPYQPGRWVGSDWPVATAMTEMYLTGHGRLTDCPDAPARLQIRSPQDSSTAAGEWMAVGCPGEMPADQRRDDAGALTFETELLQEDLEILGIPEIVLKFASDKPVAQLVVRIGDVAPDGKVTRVSYQVLNLTHRNGHEWPEPLEVGTYETVTVKLSACGHRFRPGHRLRVSIGTAYWPIIWPAPEAATLTIDTAASLLRLPVRDGGDSYPGFEPAVQGPSCPVTMLRPAETERRVSTDFLTGEVTYVTEGRGGIFGEGVLQFDEIGTSLSHNLRRELRIHPDDPLSACFKLHQEYEMGREGWFSASVLDAEMTCDAETFFLEARMRVTLNGEDVMEREWDEELARNLI
ncbi:CocE/NonD family hydrolase [Aliiruegeria sabulilitoris]|uniref:CocE/NonD family hydrolase n=1 Tax=Aliiruegeria sabulilitoris TaxID=1510458 RepID=UPI0008363CF2|nr:CocE/NonD family hydrolase [Aliiruegeria sabulilitoris]NDR58831.1 CocE/NonD family hydrolase [Pseudoruegeria sp. M32A2M]